MKCERAPGGGSLQRLVRPRLLTRLKSPCKTERVSPAVVCALAGILELANIFSLPIACNFSAEIAPPVLKGLLVPECPPMCRELCIVMRTQLRIGQSRCECAFNQYLAGLVISAPIHNAVVGWRSDQR